MARGSEQDVTSYPPSSASSFPFPFPPPPRPLPPPQPLRDAKSGRLSKQFADVDIVITTALIPGKAAPKLMTKANVESMKAGSVIVDMAAQAGGNCEGTVKDQVWNNPSALPPSLPQVRNNPPPPLFPQTVTTPNGATLIGYTDLNSRLSSTSSSLYANNQMKWILSAGPTTTKVKGEFALDEEDIAIRGMSPPHTPCTTHAVHLPSGHCGLCAPCVFRQA